MGRQRDDRRAGDRRVEARWFFLPDRRRGFERRLPQHPVRAAYHRALDHYRANRRLLFLVLILVTLLNFADLLFTHRALLLGAVEVNPLMAALFERSAELAAAVKMGLGVVTVEIMWALRRYRRTLEASVVALAIMGAIFAHHLWLLGEIPA